MNRWKSREICCRKAHLPRRWPCRPKARAARNRMARRCPSLLLHPCLCRSRYPCRKVSRRAWDDSARLPDNIAALIARHDACASNTRRPTGVQGFGAPKPDRLAWVLKRDVALQQLNAVIVRTLPHVGHFQDTMSSKAWHLFHCLLSFALNVKMLNPREVVARAQAAYHAGHASLATRARCRPGSGTAIQRCGLSQALAQSLEQAHAHHIERLRVIADFRQQAATVLARL